MFRGLSLLSLLALALVGATPYLNPPAGSTQVVLPIEVIGADGYIASTTVDVPSIGSADRLYLQLHRPAYRDIAVNSNRGAKASVRINGGPWVDVTQSNVECLAHEEAYGCLLSSYYTLRLTIDLGEFGSPGLQPGTNTVEFRFNGTDGITSGYRVLALDVLNGSGGSLAPASQFLEENPATWQAPRPSSADIAAGAQLWSTAELVESPQSGAPLIRATCASCHAPDGRDLKYFNYSNRSIEERAKFHGLTEAEAEQIVSYIRTLDSPAPENARPWNPPYQPGPGLDSRPAIEWAAGAGLEWVLDEDADMRDFVFPTGMTPGAITPDQTHNARETPVAIQLPDWNAWLPDVHPEDVWEEFFLNTTPIDGSDGDTRGDVLGHYDNLQDDLQTDGPDVMIQNGELANAISSFSSAGIKYFLDFRNGDAEAHVPGSIHIESARQSIRKWTLVQLWDIQQTYALDDVSPEVYGQYGEERSWLGGSRQMFDLAPHLAAENKLSFFYQDDLAGKTESTAWYQLQMIVNAGNRTNAGSIAPVDWNYHPKHINGLYGNEDGPEHPFRGAQAWMKLIQTFHHDGTFEEEAYIRHAHPGRWGAFVTMKNLDPSTRAAVFSTLVNAYMDAVESHAISEWDRPSNPDTPNRWEGPNYRPTLIEEGTSWQNAHQNGRYADLWYTMIPTFASWGVENSVIERMNTWGSQMWPQGDWGAIPTSTEGGETTPDRFALEPGYPNPFASTSTLAYTLPAAGPVRMEVFDLFGRRVAVLVDEERTAGRHTETLASEGMASGTYIVRLQAGAASATQRVVVLR